MCSFKETTKSTQKTNKKTSNSPPPPKKKKHLSEGKTETHHPTPPPRRKKVEKTPSPPSLNIFDACFRCREFCENSKKRRSFLSENSPPPVEVIPGQLPQDGHRKSPVMYKVGALLKTPLK